jgi:hypothetical protein
VTGSILAVGKTSGTEPILRTPSCCVCGNSELGLSEIEEESTPLWLKELQLDKARRAINAVLFNKRSVFIFPNTP